ncbi:MAG TPA: VCBS repeat-containing protein [Candidatus Solibacter sp.]|nr:VCBS repeat-containing protein [Candidatus Solibacter sp.]
MPRIFYPVFIVLFVTLPLSAQFQPRVDYAVGPSPYGAAVGDFNGDGKPDLVVANNAAHPNTLSILLGNGDGTFQPHTDIPGGGHPLQIIVADFNRDGKLDLAVANSIYNTVSVLLGNGDGTFQPLVPYATGANAQWLVAADFNGDGRLDIATANYDSDSDSVSILLGNGDGTFQRQVSFQVGVNPFGIMAADLNHDGKMDLVVVCNNGYYGVWILLGNGDGSFQNPAYNPSGYNPRVGLVTDLNADNNPDIAIANCISNSVSILFGDGAGNFASQIVYPVDVCPQTLAGGDFDGDGNLDLVTANSGGNDVSLLRGNGNGAFTSGGSFAVGNDPMWVAVADLNNDTAPDLVVTNVNDNTVSVLMNIGTDFSIAATAANPSPVNRGSTATSTVSLSLSTSFHGPVNLACSVQPTTAAPTCSFSRNPVTFDSQGNATSILTIDTSTTTAHKGNPLSFLWFPVAALVFAGAGWRASRQRWIPSLLFVVMFAGLTFQVACSGTSSSATKPTPQAYTITITGTAGSHQHTTSTSIVVQ